MKLAISTWAGHIPFYLAKENLKQESIELILDESGVRRKKMFYDGECGATLTSINALVSEFDTLYKNGRVVFVLYSMKDSAEIGSDVIVSKKEFENAQELYNKARIGVVYHSLEHFLFEYYFYLRGYSPKKDYFWVNKEKGRPEYVALLKKNEIDAAIFCQPYLSEVMKNGKFHRFPDGQEIFWPVLIELLLVRLEYLDSPQVEKLITCYMDGVKIMKQMTPTDILNKMPTKVYPNFEILTEILGNVYYHDLESNLKMFDEKKEINILKHIQDCINFSNKTEYSVERQTLIPQDIIYRKIICGHF